MRDGWYRAELIAAAHDRLAAAEARLRAAGYLPQRSAVVWPAERPQEPPR